MLYLKPLSSQDLNGCLCFNTCSSMRDWHRGHHTQHPNSWTWHGGRGLRRAGEEGRQRGRLNIGDRRVVKSRTIYILSQPFSIQHTKTNAIIFIFIVIECVWGCPGSCYLLVRVYSVCGQEREREWEYVMLSCVCVHFPLPRLLFIMEGWTDPSNVCPVTALLVPYITATDLGLSPLWPSTAAHTVFVCVWVGVCVCVCVWDAPGLGWWDRKSVV